MMERRAESKGWHVHDWDVWGWLETAAKGIGIGAAVLGVATIATSTTIEVSGVGYGVVGLAGLLSVFAVVQLLLRIKQQELISLAFAVANLVGHAGMLYLVLYAPQSAWVPMAFGGAYVAGELVKQRFLAVSGYTENGQSPAQMMRLSRTMAGLVFALVVLAWLR